MVVNKGDQGRGRVRIGRGRVRIGSGRVRIGRGRVRIGRGRVHNAHRQGQGAHFRKYGRTITLVVLYVTVTCWNNFMVYTVSVYVYFSIEV